MPGTRSTVAILSADEERVRAALESDGEAHVSLHAGGGEPELVERDLRELRRRFPELPLVAVVADDAGARAAVAAGADGVVLTADAAATLVATVEAVRCGQVVLPGSEYTRARPAVVLSHRERQVLRLAVEGLSNDAIARELFVSLSTVKSHLTTAFAKLAVRSRSEAAAVLLDPDEPAGRLVFGEPEAGAEALAAGGSR